MHGEWQRRNNVSLGNYAALPIEAKHIIHLTIGLPDFITDKNYYTLGIVENQNRSTIFFCICYTFMLALKRPRK